VFAAEDVVRRIAAERAYVDEKGGVGIRLKPAAAIVREYGAQLRQALLARPATRAKRPSGWRQRRRVFFSRGRVC
jgi:hypothetical protein